MPFINRPDSSSDLTIFMISLIFSLEIINVVIREAKSEGQPDPNILLFIAASVADAAAVNPNGIRTILANVFSTFFNKGNQFFSNGPKNLPKNPPGCPILCNWIFDNFVLVGELFANALESFETCVLVNNNLSRKLFSSLDWPTTFDEIFKVTSVPFFIHDFNLLSCDLDNFTFGKFYWIILN